MPYFAERNFIAHVKETWALQVYMAFWGSKVTSMEDQSYILSWLQPQFGSDLC